MLWIDPATILGNILRIDPAETLAVLVKIAIVLHKTSVFNC